MVNKEEEIGEEKDLIIGEEEEIYTKFIITAIGLGARGYWLETRQKNPSKLLSLTYLGGLSPTNHLISEIDFKEKLIATLHKHQQFYKLDSPFHSVDKIATKISLEVL